MFIAFQSVAKGEDQVRLTFDVLVSISAWVLFIGGLVLFFVPVIVGLATGNLVGVLWFWRHGFSFLLGVMSLTASAYVVKARKGFD